MIEIFLILVGLVVACFALFCGFNLLSVAWVIWRDGVPRPPAGPAGKPEDRA